MIANNSGSSHHTEKDLWLQVLALAKEIQDCKSYLYPKTLESIYDNIVRIEKLLDILLIIQSKKSAFRDSWRILNRQDNPFIFN